MKRVFIYYLIGFAIATGLGYYLSKDPIKGFVVGALIYMGLLAFVSIFFGLAGSDPTNDSPYYKRKKK